MNINRKRLWIGILAGLITVSAWGQEESGTANTNEPAVPAYSLDPFVVTGTVLPLPASAAASDIDYLEGDDLLFRQSASLGTTLEFLPGVSTINTGSGAALPVIRGLSGNRIRVLQDGVGVNYQQFGVRHPPNIDPFLAGRIEIVRGVSSILYGSDAFGGAINVLSPEIPFSDDAGVSNFDGRGTYAYESGHDLNTGAVNLAYGSEEFGLVAGVVYRDAGDLSVPDVETWNGRTPSGQPSDIPEFAGDLDFTDYEQLNTMIKGGYRIGPSEFTLRFERWDNENNYLLPNGKAPVPGGIGVDLENNQLQAVGMGSLTSDWEWKASYTWNQNLRQANPAGQPLPVSSNPDVDLTRNSHTLRTQATYGDWQDLFSGTLGFEGLYEDQKSTGTTGLSPGGEIGGVGLFGLGRYALENGSLEAGLRFDHRSQDADPSQTSDPGLLVNRVNPVTGLPVNVNLDNEYNAVTASLGGVYDLTDSFALAANVNRGFRAPTLFELYADGVHGGVAAFQFGNTDLESETSLGGDLQARWSSEKLDLTATGFVTSINDYIFLADTGAVVPGTTLPIFTYGQADAVLYGGDIAASYRPLDWLTANAVYEQVKGEFDAGGELPLMPADQFRFELVFHRESVGVLDQPEFRIGVRHAAAKDAAGPEEPFSQFDRNPNFGTASTDAYTLLDLGVGFVIDRFRLNVDVRNVTDEAYRDFLDTYKAYALSPGRSINVRGSISF